METRWTVYGKRADFKAIAERFQIDQVVARVIRNRDIVGDAEIERYLYGTLADVHNPADIADMETGCEIMAEKIRAGKAIRIISDYDVDGIMSNYILYDGLRALGAAVSYEIPDRVADGYGINERMIREAREDGVDTIITCDNGIAAFPAVELAKTYGMTVIVTDHHEVPYEPDAEGNRRYRLVPADAVIDIKREDCRYPYKKLCGAAVAYKFIRHLYAVMGQPWEDEERYIEFVAIATQCDVMELTDENRIYVRKGLEILPRTSNFGLRALIAANGLAGKRIYSYHLGFVLGPCLNAAGRLESAKKGMALLLCGDEEKALALAEELRDLNVRRKEMTEQGVQSALEQVEHYFAEDKVLVIFLPELHESLAGIVAGRVREQYYRPVYVVTKSESGMLKGSGRSIEGYHMFDALTECSQLLAKYGGHAMAAGFSLEEENLDGFRRLLNENQHMTEEDLTPVLRLDVPMPMSYITPKLVEDLRLLEPFGCGNEKPVFGQAGMRIKQAKFVGAGQQYIRITFMDRDGYYTEGIDFHANNFITCIKLWFSEEECDKMLKGLPNDIILDVAYYPEVNVYGGHETVQVRPVMYRKSR